MRHLFLLLFCILISCTVKTVNYDSPKYAKISAPNGTTARYTTDFKSKAVKSLPSGSVIKVTKETQEKFNVDGYGSSRIYKIQTRSGIEGWVFGKFITFVDHESAKKSTDSELEQFDVVLRQIALDTIKYFIAKENLHPGSTIEAIKLISVSNTENSSICEVNISVYMVGSFLGMNKYQVDLNVYLEITEIDYLSAAGVKINQITVVTDKKTDGPTWKESFELVKPFLPHLKKLLRYLP